MDQQGQQPRPLSPADQALRLDLRRRIKNRALALARWAARQDVGLPAVAGRIGIAPRTLEEWSCRHQCHALEDCPRGRHGCILSGPLRREVLDLLDHHDGRLGLPTLKALFPEVPRTALAQIRQDYVQDHDGSTEQLTWTRPGSVWAADYTKVPSPIDGRYPHVLSVRDLAASYHLLAWPIEHATAATSCAAFSNLFAAFGPPLVLKTDNGSHFIAGAVLDLLDEASVTLLPSPPRTPRYNGAAEAAIGAIKTRALAIAAAHGRPDCWSCDDLEAARIEANRDARPWGPTGPAPQEQWNTRAAILAPDRQRFGASVAAAFAEEIDLYCQSAQASPESTPAVPLGALQRAVLTRRAIRRALLDLGFLLLRRTAN